MTHSPFSKLVLKYPLLSLLQTSKKASENLQIQAQLTTTNLISDTFAASRMIISLTSGALSMNYAELVFSQIEHPSTFIWNTMIKGYIESSNPCRAFHFYRQMLGKNVLGDNHTYPYVLKASGMMLGLNEGREIHGEVLKRGFASGLFVRNALISMYCRCGDIVCGRTLFDGFHNRDLVSWNSMISGYVRCGEMYEAQKMFDEMLERDVFTWAMMIDVYGKKLGDISRGRELFDRIPDRDVACWNSMIDGYVNHGKMVAARELFEEMPKKNVVSWSIMIDGYARFGNTKEALSLFNQMLHHGTKPDKISTMGAISACAQLGALDHGRWIHTYIQKNKIILDIIVQTALLDMYMKCGSLEEARIMFQSMRERNIISWNVMIAGLGAHGFGEEAVELFAQMELQGMPMDDLIFLSVLTACSHAGLVTNGLDVFKKMASVYGIKPKLEHYGCLVDLLGRAGQLDEARNVIESMPMEPNSALWGSLLAACKTHQNVPLAEVSVGRLVELKADDCGVYVILSNIYAEEGMWKDVLKVRKLMGDRGIKKAAGRSVIEVDGEVEEFVNGERSHSSTEEIDLVIRSLSMMILSVGLIVP